MVLGREARIAKITRNIGPMAEATVIKSLQVIGNDKGDDTRSKALLEEKKTPNTAIAILEGMNTLKPHVEFKQVIQRFMLYGIVVVKEGNHLTVHTLGSCGFYAPHLVGQALVVAHGEP